MPDQTRMDSEPLITPMTALVIDDNGRLTYMGQDGQRRVIVGDPDLLRRISEIRRSDEIRLKVDAESEHP